MTPDEVVGRILSVALDVAGVDLAAVDRDADLFDLGIDSLEFGTIVVEFEDRLSEPLTSDAFDRLAELEHFSLNALAVALADPRS